MCLLKNIASSIDLKLHNVKVRPALLSILYCKAAFLNEDKAKLQVNLRSLRKLHC